MKRCRKSDPRACKRCGEVKPPDAFPPVRSGVRLSRICWPCTEREAYDIDTGLSSWMGPSGRVRRCSHCGQVKDFEGEFYHYDGTGKIYRAATCRSCKVVMAREWVQRHPEERRIYWRERSRVERKLRPERCRKRNKRFRERRKADPERYKRYLENRRMDERLRKEREGRKVVRMMKTATKKPDLQPKLPSKPLADFIESLAGERSLDEVCEMVTVTARSFRGWRSGEYKEVQFDVADRVMINAGALMQDIWPEDEYPELYLREAA